MSNMHRNTKTSSRKKSHSAKVSRGERTDGGIRANILLGQRFLQSSAVLADIIAAAEISSHDTILEVGPGAGALTRALLLARPKRVIAVEKDARFATYLRETFKDSGTLEIIEGDILQLLDAQHFPVLDAPYKVVANLPYYLTSHFLNRMTHTDRFPHPERMVLLIQKEVATRMLGAKGNQKESLLSLGITTHATPKIICSVPPGAFHLPPKVHSAVILLTHISERFFTENHCDEKIFFTIAKKSFGGKRKMLRSTLSKEFAHIAEHNPSSPLLELKSRRPETLTKEEWAELARVLKPIL